jgi:hypothetical protein
MSILIEKEFTYPFYSQSQEKNENAKSREYREQCTAKGTRRQTAGKGIHVHEAAFVAGGRTTTGTVVSSLWLLIETPSNERGDVIVSQKPFFSPLLPAKQEKNLLLVALDVL